MLEAYSSNPAAQDFEWELVAGTVPVVATGEIYTPENPPPERKLEGKKTGHRIEVVALASFTATVVAKGALIESAPFQLSVRVQPREWKTSFVQRTQVKTFSKYYSANALLEQHAGSNVCTMCGFDVEYGHYIHRNSERLDWKQEFGVKQVKDPGGPFDGLWYVDSANLRIDRTMFVNKELTEGQVYRLNTKPGVPKAYKEALAQRVECTKLHEKLHGDLIKEQLDEAGVDPAPRVEPLIADDEESLADQASLEVALKETVLSNATTGPEGHGKLRRRLEAQLKATRVKFLLPRTREDTEGVEVETDLLGFSD